MLERIKKWWSGDDVKRSQGIVWLNGDAPWYSEPTASGVRPNTQSVFGLPGFKRAVEFIANKIATCELNTFRRLPSGGREFAREHPVFNLLKVAPSEWLTPFDLKKQQIVDCLYSGNSYTYVTRQGTTPVELTILDPDCVVPTVVHDGARRSVVYMFNSAEGMQALNPENVIHLKGLSFGNSGLVGNSLLEYCAEVLGLSLAVQRYASVYFRHGSLQNAHVEMIDGAYLDEEKEQKMLAALRRLYGGVDNSQAPMILQGGAKLIRSNLSMTESQALAARGFTLTDIANIVGIDPTFIGGDSKAQGYNSLQAAAVGLLGNTFLPFLVQSEQQHNRKLLRTDEWESVYIEYDRTDLERGDKEYEQRVLERRFFSGQISWQQMRETLNQSTEPDDGETFYLPSNLVRFDPNAPMPEPQPVQQPGAPFGAEDPKPDDEPKADGDEVKRAAVVRLANRVRRDCERHGTDDLIARHARIFAEALPGVDTYKMLADLQQELDAVLPEQRAAILETLETRWNV